MVRALGIPTVMGADIQPSVLHKRTLIVDGYRGELLVDPEPVLIQEYQRLISEEIELSRIAEDDVNRPAQLKSGESIKVMLNAGLSPEHEEKLGSRIDGIGLYRTEIPLCYKAVFHLKKSRWRSIRECCKCSTINLLRCERWMLVQINNCLICLSVKRIRVWDGGDSHNPRPAGDLSGTGACDAAR